MPKHLTTYYAVVVDGVVLGSRESISRHVGGSGKFGPYTHAVIVRRELETAYTVLSYHGSAPLAQITANHARQWYVSTLVVPVTITPKKLKA